MAAQNSEYNVDIVMCIDGTGSMSPIIDEVKAKALSFHNLLMEGLDVENITVDQIRVKVIVFRDYECDSEPMVESDFFTLPEGLDKYEAFVKGIEACGGGDAPENALEALALALKSDWTRGGTNRRHLIVVFTDAPALELGERAGSPNYPTNLPKNFSELSGWWEGHSQDLRFQAKKGRMILLAPEDESWKKLESWNRVFTSYSKPGEGMAEFDMQTIVDMITHTLK